MRALNLFVTGLILVSIALGGHAVANIVTYVGHHH